MSPEGRTKNLAVVLGCFASVAACSDAAAVTPDTATDTATDAATDATDADTPADVPADANDVADTGAPPSTPILERPPEVTHTCVETLAPPEGAFDPGHWQVLGFVATGTGAADAPWIVRATDNRIVLSPVGRDGALGTPEVLLDTDPYVFGRVALGYHDHAFIVVWPDVAADFNSSDLYVAIASDSGTLTTPPKVIPGTRAASIMTVRMARAPVAGGWVLMWVSSPDNRSTTVHAATLAADGSLGEIHDLAASDFMYGTQALGLAADDRADGAGFAAAWGKAVTGEGKAEVWFGSFGSDGGPRYAPRRISREAKDGYSAGVAYQSNAPQAVFVDGARTWVAFTEEHVAGDDFNSPGSVTVRIAALDADGNGPLHTLAAPVDEKVVANATFFAFDDTLGLLWTYGTRIVICGGCYVDYDLNVMLLDKDTLVPRSVPVAHTHRPHGFASPNVAVLGDEVFSLSSQDFHALSFPAAARMRCSRP